jgi:hypothetical protein
MMPLERGTRAESESAPIIDSRRLAIPIYLNQRIVFDLLAIIEGGFSQFRTIRTFSTEEESASRALGGSIGVSNVFALLGIGVQSTRNRAESSGKQREESEERVVTPTSVFSSLRDSLIREDLLKKITSDEELHELSTETFVEFSAMLRKNPLIDVLETIAHGADLDHLLKGPQASGNRKGSSRDGESTKNSRSVSGGPAVGQQLRSIISMVSQPNTIDLIGDMHFGGYRAVIPVEYEFFSSSTPASIIDGEFVVLGKTVRHIKDGSDESINLLRGTSFGLFNEDTIDEMVAALSGMSQGGVALPDISPKIPPPCVQVVPIAIYA